MQITKVKDKIIVNVKTHPLIRMLGPERSNSSKLILKINPIIILIKIHFYRNHITNLLFHMQALECLVEAKQINRHQFLSKKQVQIKHHIFTTRKIYYTEVNQINIYLKADHILFINVQFLWNLLLYAMKCLHSKI